MILCFCMVYVTTLHPQNIPQLALQIYFLVTEHNHSKSVDLVVYGAMLFSLISIISNALTFCTQREIAKTTGWDSIQFDVTNASDRSTNLWRSRRRVKRIKQEIAAILEIDRSLVEV